MIAVDFAPLIDTTVLLAVAQQGGVLFTTFPVPYIEYDLRQQPLIAAFKNLDVYWRPRLVVGVFVPFNNTGLPIFLQALEYCLEYGLVQETSNWAIALSGLRTAAFSTAYAFQIPRGAPILAHIYVYIGGSVPEGEKHESLWAQTYDLQYNVSYPLYGVTGAIFPPYKYYPQGFLPYPWQHHYDGQQQMTYAQAVSNKQTFDPHNVLGGGLQFP